MERACNDPLHEAAQEAVSWVAARFVRAGMPFERAELENEGWRACLESRHNYDSARGPAVAYFRRIARRAVGKFCSKRLAKVSIGKHYEEGAKHQSGVEVEDWIHGEIDPRYAEGLGDKLTDGPELRLLAKERDRRQARFIKSVRAAVREILRGWHPYDRFLVMRITGLDGHEPESPRDLARRVGCPVARVYKAHARLTDEMWGHTELLLLHLNGAEEEREDR